jgi:hypothetical protein
MWVDGWVGSYLSGGLLQSDILPPILSTFCIILHHTGHSCLYIHKNAQYNENEIYTLITFCLHT